MQKQFSASQVCAREPYKTLSRMKMFLFSFLASCLVLIISLVIQWFVYDDWLHRTGPLRIVGTSIAAVVTFAFVLRWQLVVREKQREMIHRFEMIADMNDRIRNALQAIECVTYVSRPEETDSVRQAVDVIDRVLHEVIADAGRSAWTPPRNKATATEKTTQKIA